MSSWPLQILLLPASLPLEGKRAPRTVITSVCHQTNSRFVLLGLAKKTKMFQELICIYGLFHLWVQDKMHWWRIFLLPCQGRIRMHYTTKDVVQCLPDNLGKWFEWSDQNASFTLVFSAVHLCPFHKIEEPARTGSMRSYIATHSHTWQRLLTPTSLWMSPKFVYCLDRTNTHTHTHTHTHKWLAWYTFLPKVTFCSTYELVALIRQDKQQCANKDREEDC